MTVVYVDLLFVLNFAANYLLLLGAGRMSGTVLRRGRIALGAAVGALYAVLSLLPGMEWSSFWLCRILVGIVLPLIAYGGTHMLLRNTLLFFGASAGLAGLILAAEMLGGAGLTTKHGVLYSQFDFRLLLLLFAVCYAVMSLFFRRSGRHICRELVELDIQICCRTIKVTALLDSGHTLTDPATNRPVIVADVRCFQAVLPPELDPKLPVEGMKICCRCGLTGARLVPYCAVGVECGMLLAVKAESVYMRGQNIGSLLIALSPTSISGGGAYQALIGGI